MPNGRWRDLAGFVCENGRVLVAVANNLISKWPPAAIYGAGAGVLIIGLLIGVLINRQRGHRAIAQRLQVSTVVVERGPVAFFAESVFDGSPEYQDARAAMAAGWKASKTGSLTIRSFEE